MRVTSVALFVVIVYALIGCHPGGSAAVVGKWQGSAGTVAGKADDSGQKMANEVAKLISFEFKADNTFTGSLVFPVEGTYTVSGDTVTLSVTKMMGMPATEKSDNKPLVLKLSGDGKTLTAINPSGKDGGKFELTKQG